MTPKLDTLRHCVGHAGFVAALVLAVQAPALAQGNPFLTPGAGTRPAQPAAPPPAVPAATTGARPFAAATNPAAALAAAPASPAAPTPTAPAATPATAPAGLVSLEQKNVFDPDRKIWPDRIPPPPPPPPPPTPPPVTEQELQLYGTVLVGNVKRATVRLGGRFASITQGGRPYTQLTEGQALGEYTVSQIQPTQIVLSAAGTQQAIVFTKKTDRPAASLVPPVIQTAAVTASPSPVAAPAVAPQQTASDTVAPGTAPASAPAAPPQVSPVPQSGAVTGSADSGPGVPSAPANSLAAAIAAAQAAAAQGNRQPTVNPFLPK